MSTPPVMNALHSKLITAILEELEDDHLEFGMSREQFVEVAREMWAVWGEHVRKGRPKIASRHIPMVNSIQLYFNCGLCMKSKPPELSMEEWGSYMCGWTAIGFQVVCKRHRVNVMHVDFEGQAHPSENRARREH